MRFIHGPIPSSRTFDPVAARWTPLQESDSRRFVAVTLLCMLPFLLGATILFLHAAPELRPIFQRHLWSLPCFLVLLLALVPTHEFIHALAYGCGLRSPNLLVGFWPQRGMAYVLCDTPLPRRRVLIMLAAPFVVLSVLPLLATFLLSGPWLLLVSFLSILHAAFCTGDAVAFLRLLSQAPANALIHNQGWKTYWSIPPNANVASMRCSERLRLSRWLLRRLRPRSHRASLRRR